MQETCRVTHLFFPTRKQYHMTPMPNAPMSSQCFRSPVSPGPPSWPRPLTALGSPMQAAMASGGSGEYRSCGRQHTPTDKTRSGRAEAQTVCWRNLNRHRSDRSEGSIPPCLFLPPSAGCRVHETSRSLGPGIGSKRGCHRH